jgi:hypothetical protein
MTAPRPDPVAWINAVLRNPETRQPFELLPAELAFLQRCFELNDDGSARYPELLYCAPKKSGKSTFGAILVLVIVLLFGGHDAEANIAANDFDQAQSRVFAMIKKIIRASPALRDHADVLQSTVRFHTGGTIDAIASDAASAAGGNQNVSCFDELWGFATERGNRFWDEMTPPPTRRPAWRLTVSYSGFAGESVLLEGLYKRGLAAPEVAPDLRATNDGLLMFWSHKPVAPWQDARWIEQMRATMRPNAFRRMICNEWVSSESSFVEMRWWDSCTDPQMRPVLSDKNLNVWIGIDASVKRDSTAIVAVTADGTAVRLISHRIFQPSPDDPLDFEKTIEATILELQRRFTVVAVLFDPYQMQSTAQRLTKAGLPMHEFPQSMPNLTAASTNLFEIVKHRNLAVYPDADMRLAISRAIAVETSRGWRITKEKAAHKIDVVVALAQACYGALHVACNGAEGWLRYYAHLNEGIGTTDMDDLRVASPDFGFNFTSEPLVRVLIPPQLAAEGGMNIAGNPQWRR